MDLSKIKEKLAGLKSGSENSKWIWKPKPGINNIRIVPYIHRIDDPFLEVHFYYKMAKKTLVSPVSYGGADPIQDFVDQLKSTGETEDWKLGNTLQAKMRTFVPVLVRGKEDEGVKFWGFAKTVYQELLSAMDDPACGDITDLKNGRDLKVEYTKGEGGAYDKTTCVVAFSQTPATKSAEVVKSLKEMPKIEEIFAPASIDELNAALKRFVENSDEADETEEGETSTETETADADLDLDLDVLSDLPFDQPAAKAEPKSKAAAKTEPKVKAAPKTAAKNDLVASSKEDVDDAFDDLFK